MHYLIDGYNLLFRLVESKKSLQAQRQSIIRSLQKEFKHLHLQGTIVFDGSHKRGEQSGLSYQSPLIIAYSHSGETADQYILERLETASSPSEITVVTDDRSLASAARALKARTLSLKSFLAMLEKKYAQKQHKKEDRHDSHPFQESKKDFERLLKIFEERLKKELSEEKFTEW
jgi:predicted RNA-binding protein with PIN domain